MTRDHVYLAKEMIQNESENLLEHSSSILQKFGLSTNQSKIYLCLSRIGPKTASQLSKFLEIPRTETYHLLKTLQVKGCVVIINYKPLKYEAVSIEDFFEKIINLEKNKIKKLEKTLEMIKKFKDAKHQINPKQIC